MLMTAAAVHQSTGIGKKRGASAPNGILQRFEIQMADAEEIPQHESCCSTSQQLEIITDPSEAVPIVRCPCCRSSQAKLICVNCVCKNVLRIGRIKDEFRRLQQSKVAVCNLIENALIEEVKFESESQQLKRSIENLKTKIAWKKDEVGRLKQRIANMEGQSERNHRNVVLLQKKMVSHAQRIKRTNLKIVDIRGYRAHAKIKLAEQILQISKPLFQMFHCEKRQLFAAGERMPPVWTGQIKMHRAAVYLLNNCLCLDRTTLLAKAFAQNPPKNNVDPVNLPEYQQISSTQLPNHFPHDSLAALTFAAQLAQMLAHLFHFHLPYPQLHKTMMLLPAAGGIIIPQESALRQAMFKLDFSCLHLCLSQGMSPEECQLTEPLANLHALIIRVLAGKMVDCVPRFDQRLLRQICEQFTAVQPDGRVLSEFTLDNVENDWVKVHCSS